MLEYKQPQRNNLAIRVQKQHFQSKLTGFAISYEIMSSFLVEAAISKTQQIQAFSHKKEGSKPASPKDLFGLTTFFRVKAQRRGFDAKKEEPWSGKPKNQYKNWFFAAKAQCAPTRRRVRDSLFCGKATPVETCHRHVSKSRLSNPTKTH